MSKLANLYADEVKKHFKVLYANWEPGMPLALGDYGIMDGNVFIPMGKIESDFPTEFPAGFIKITPDPTKDQKEFISESGVTINFGAKGSINSSGVTLAKATLEIKFSQKDSIFFNAAECTTVRIENKIKVGDKLLSLHKQKKWQKEYCVVTDLVSAGKTIVAISQSNSSGISFEADSPAIEKINLADASVKLNLTSENSIGYKVTALDGLNILMGLCKIRNPFPWVGGPVFKSRTLLMSESMIQRIEDSPHIMTEKSPDELVFGQLGM